MAILPFSPPSSSSHFPPQLDPSHLVRGVFLDRTDWTAENGFATPMLKLKRKALLKNYRKRLTDIYDELKAEAKAALEAERGRGDEPVRGGETSEDESEPSDD